MKIRLNRREMMKSVAGLSVAGGMAGMFTGCQPASPAPVQMKEEINVGVSPPGPKSLELLERMKKVIGRTNYVGLYGVAIADGAGAYVADLDGNVYLDCLAAATTNVLGYSHDEVAEAYFEAAKRMQNSCFPYSTNVYAVELAENLVRIAPGDFPKKALLGLSGSDSCGGSIEAMRKFTGRTALIKFENAYHGSTGLSQPASGFRSLNEGIYPPSPDFISMPFPVTEERRDEVLSQIDSILAQGKVGAVMAEPIQGDAGILVPAEGFFPRLREMLDGYGVLLIVDEVQSGMGRSGKWWAIEHEGITPDIMVVAKGLSGGYAPISALIGRQEIIDALAPAQHLFTYTGHPPASAAATAVIRTIEKEGIAGNAGRMGDRILAGLRVVQQNHPDVLVEARGRGLMLGCEIDVSKDELAGKIFAMRCLEKGIYFGYFGDKQQVLRIEPPLIIDEGQADLIVSTVGEVAKEMQSGTIPQATIDKVRNYAIGL
ncbi:MAG TPA: aspartate aminotransferase family protein [Acidobacteriota bacterium]|nr:aspartate aminotransferase family protein [Acidobacteriota bacterium]